MSPAARIFTAVQCVHRTVVCSATTCTAVRGVPYSTSCGEDIVPCNVSVLPVLRIFQHCAMRITTVSPAARMWTASCCVQWISPPTRSFTAVSDGRYLR